MFRLILGISELINKCKAIRIYLRGVGCKNYHRKVPLSPPPYWEDVQ